MRRNFLRNAAGLLAMLLCGACVDARAQVAADALPGKPAPAFVRMDIDHRRVDLAALRGRVVLLTFWATWCAPCQAEMPRFIAWQKRFGPDGLQIVAVSMDDSEAPVRRLVRRRGLNYPVVMGDAALGTLYGGVLGLPVTFLIDRQGNIAAKFKGETNLGAMERGVIALVHAH